MDFKDTELTLALPGGGGGGSCSSAAADNVSGGFKSGSCSMKRGFMETSTGCGTRGEIIVDGNLEAKKYSSSSSCSSSTTISATTIAPAMKIPAAQARVVGWPPVRLTRQKTVVESKSKFVKVGADGAPYLRKLDLEMYTSYEELLRAIEKMFTSFTIRRMEEKRNEVIKPAVKGRDEYVVAYEDKDGDWMLVGDVPWKMFIESCKRVRLMKSSEAVGIATSLSVRKPNGGHIPVHKRIHYIPHSQGQCQMVANAPLTSKQA